MTIRTILGALALAGVFPILPAFAQNGECAPSPCDPKEHGRARCEAAADWVIEGELASLTDEFGPSCAGCDPHFRWIGATAVLNKAKGVKISPDEVFKGAIVPIEFGGVKIVASSPCWERTARVDRQAIAKVVRFYGTNKLEVYPLQIAPGYFAYEVVGAPPEKAQ